MPGVLARLPQPVRPPSGSVTLSRRHRGASIENPLHPGVCVHREPQRNRDSATEAISSNRQVLSNQVSVQWLLEVARAFTVYGFLISPEAEPLKTNAKTNMSGVVEMTFPFRRQPCSSPFPSAPFCTET